MWLKVISAQTKSDMLNVVMETEYSTCRNMDLWQILCRVNFKFIHRMVNKGLIENCDKAMLIHVYTAVIK